MKRTLLVALILTCSGLCGTGAVTAVAGSISITTTINTSVDPAQLPHLYSSFIVKGYSDYYGSTYGWGRLLHFPVGSIPSELLITAETADALGFDWEGMSEGILHETYLSLAVSLGYYYEVSPGVFTSAPIAARMIGSTIPQGYTTVDSIRWTYSTNGNNVNAQAIMQMSYTIPEPSTLWLVLCLMVLVMILVTRRVMRSY